MVLHSCSALLLLALLARRSHGGSSGNGPAMSFADGLLSSIPAGFCLDHHAPGEYWSYRWCHRANVTQYRGRSHRLKSQEQVLGERAPKNQGADRKTHAALLVHCSFFFF